jgi:hypothetical protein
MESRSHGNVYSKRSNENRPANLERYPRLFKGVWWEMRIRKH